jgi:hypothetical protein
MCLRRKALLFKIVFHVQQYDFQRSADGKKDCRRQFLKT